MARSKREKSPIGVYHVVMRGREGLFYEKADHEYFKGLLRRYFSSDDKMYAYCIEKNKVHMVFFSEKPELVMKSVLTSYARYFNRKNNKDGKVFSDRYMCEAAENADMMTGFIRFVNTKPGDVSSIDEYKNNADICNIKGIGKKADISSLTDKKTALPYMDSYADMSDEEIREYFEYLKGKTALKNKTGAMRIIEEAAGSSNLAKSRLMRIFGLSSYQASDNKKKEKPVSEKKDTKQKPKAAGEKKKPSIEKPKEQPKAPENAPSEEKKDEGNKKKKELSVWLL